MEHEHKYKKECYTLRCLNVKENKCIETCIYCNKKRDISE